MNANVMQKGTHMSVHIYRLTLSKRALLTGHQSYNTSSRLPSSFARPRLHRRTPSPSSSPALAFVSAHPRPRPSPPSPTQFLLPTPPPPPPRRLAPKGQRAARKATRNCTHEGEAMGARERYGRGETPSIFLASEGNYRGGAWSSAKQGGREGEIGSI